MSQDRYVYLHGDIELHYAGDAPASQPAAGQASRYRLRPTLERHTNSRARLYNAKVLDAPHDLAQLRADPYLDAGALAAVQVELAPNQTGAGQVFREDLLHVLITRIELSDVMHQGGRTYGTLRGKGYATLLVPAPVVPAVEPAALATSWWSWLPTGWNTTRWATALGSTHGEWPAWLGLGRVLRYLFLGWLAIGLFGTGWWGPGLVLGLLYWFLAPVLPAWLGLGAVLRFGLGGGLLLFGLYHGWQHHWLKAALWGGAGLLVLLGGGRAVGAVAGAVLTGLQLVVGLAVVAFLALAGFAWFNQQPNDGRAATLDPAEATGQLHTTPPPPRQPPADSLLMSHLRRWNDLAGHHYEGRLAVAQNQYFRARQVRENIPSRDGQPQGEAVSPATLYGTLASTDAERLPRIYALFDSLGRARGLSREQFAQMVVTCVQDIPYALVHQSSCDEFDRRAPELISSHDRRTCQPNIRFGVQSPAEFMYNLKADCDTRAVFLYTVLRHFGYDAALLVSDHYSHAVLGLAQPTASPSYVERNGHRYYAWETTATGFPLGMLAPQMANMRYWEVAVAAAN